MSPKRVKEAVTLADLCPTLSEIGGADEICAEWGSSESASFANLLTGDDPNWRDSATMQYFGPGIEAPWFAIRKGDFKAVSARGGKWELYNIAKDRSELNNLAAADPQRAAELAELWHKVAENVDTAPAKLRKPSKDKVMSFSANQMTQRKAGPKAKPSDSKQAKNRKTKK
jgi:arylsulfatase